jgi:hypothetical protein
MKKVIAAGVGLVVFVVSAPVWAGSATSGPDPHPMPPVVAEHVDQHLGMTEQMRTMGVDPRMTADPMWADMRNPGHIAAEEHAQEQLDRMLAR